MRGYRAKPAEKVCKHCGKTFSVVKSAQQQCDACMDLKNTRRLEYIKQWRAENPDKYREIGRRYDKKRGAVKTEYNKTLRAQLEAERFAELFSGLGPDDFFAAVNGPLRKWDRKVHIKCGDVAAVMVCGRSHNIRARWLRPSPNRNVTCKKCLAIWERLFPGEPIPVAPTDEWDSDKERDQWGF